MSVTPGDERRWVIRLCDNCGQPDRGGRCLEDRDGIHIFACARFVEVVPASELARVEAEGWTDEQYAEIVTVAEQTRRRAMAAEAERDRLARTLDALTGDAAVEAAERELDEAPFDADSWDVIRVVLRAARDAAEKEAGRG